MTWHWISASLWQRLLVALLIVGAASAFRVVFFDALGRGIPYLVFYPAVMLAALYGGLPAGVLATALSVPLSFFWVQRGYLSPPKWLGMGVFVLSCLTVSAIGEAMRRAQVCSKAVNQELQREMAEHKQAEERIRAVKPGVKVLFMSGYSSDVIAQRGVLDEGVQFLSKPFLRDDLARKVREVLG